MGAQSVCVKFVLALAIHPSCRKTVTNVPTPLNCLPSSCVMALRQVARHLSGLSHVYPQGLFAPLGDACLRAITSISGAQLAEPQLAQAEEPASAVLPRWERELGAVRTDWT